MTFGSILLPLSGVVMTAGPSGRRLLWRARLPRRRQRATVRPRHEHDSVSCCATADSIAHRTPAEVHAGGRLALVAVRRSPLDRASMAHPARFVRGRPVAIPVPGPVWINRPEQEPADNTPRAVAASDESPRKSWTRSVDAFC